MVPKVGDIIYYVSDKIGINIFEVKDVRRVSLITVDVYSIGIFILSGNYEYDNILVPKQRLDSNESIIYFPNSCLILNENAFIDYIATEYDNLNVDQNVSESQWYSIFYFWWWIL